MRERSAEASAEEERGEQELRDVMARYSTEGASGQRSPQQSGPGTLPTRHVRLCFPKTAVSFLQFLGWPSLFYADITTTKRQLTAARVGCT